MELDDLKTAMRALEERMAEVEARSVSTVRNAQLGKVRWRLRDLVVGQAVQIAVAVALIGAVAPFWFAERATVHWLVMGLTLHLYGLAAIVLSARQLFLMATTDLAAPVVTLQHKLAVLRRARLWTQLILGLPWWCLWLVATLVLVRIVTGADLYEASPSWVWMSLAVGVVGMVLTLWIPRRLAASPRGSRFVQDRLDDLAGRSLVRATRELDDLADFNREP